MKVQVLGGGQEVGKSCFLLTINSRRILFDCGVHPAYHDARRFPDFATIDDISTIDLVLITHFHIDHCGALPYLTEAFGYSGPIYMTRPTKDLARLMLEDLLKNSRERKQNIGFEKNNIDACMSKVKEVVEMREKLVIDGMSDVDVRMYHAGHVLGAVMFYVKVGDESVLYTGDYSTATERHLPPVDFPVGLTPDLLISEATYCTATRTGTRTSAELSLMEGIYKSLSQGGKVLIPVSAFGRAQELMTIIGAHLARMELDVPMYVTAGLVTKANSIYTQHTSWCTEEFYNPPDAEFSKGSGKLGNNSTRDYMFHGIKEFWRSRDWHLIEEDAPMVLFATPGMLTSGLSLEVFKEWAGDSKNTIVVPGFCFSTSFGAASAEDNTPTLPNMRCKLVNLPFSAHTDARGIRRMIRKVDPKAVMLVHGNEENIASFKKQIIEELGLPVYDPANGTTINIDLSTGSVSKDTSKEILQMIDPSISSRWADAIESYRNGMGHLSQSRSRHPLQ